MLEVHIFEYQCGTFVVDVAYSYRTESDYFASLCSGRLSLPMGEGLNVIASVVDCLGLLLVRLSIIWAGRLGGVIVGLYAFSPSV